MALNVALPAVIWAADAGIWPCLFSSLGTFCRVTLRAYRNSWMQGQACLTRGGTRLLIQESEWSAASQPCLCWPHCVIQPASLSGSWSGRCDACVACGRCG